MPQFQVKDMTCKHCEATISNAIKELDSKANIAIDLATHSVSIESVQNEAVLEAAIHEAGFTPVLITA